ncbi:pimeloyl-ACP methyl ester carboxylesterase [Modestobacter roseus]|uniref:Pimeloyl-ACP methyl ester carboxylesterase n=1 Tax=Modestobacter roseus TaxID=1181884 RepID=A0A562IRT3_9ACTN|nr:pimeloyl-ACP methyl ester carboxylesterase [Modestobacter roseus]
MSSGGVPGVPRTGVVWVPGLGLDRRSSARVRGRIGGAVVHLPGLGRRETVPPAPVLAARLAAELPAGRVVLVGHSQSCGVVAALAEHDPRVAGVLLLGPTPDPRTRRLRVLAGRWARTAVHEPWWQVPLLLAQWATTGPVRMSALWRRTSGERLDGRLRRVRVPVVVLRGSHDALCPHDWARQLAAAAPHGRLVELPGAAHMTPQTHPDEVAAVVADLVRQVS